MLAMRLTEHEERSIRKAHEALIPAYIMREDGSVMRFWPSGHIEQAIRQRGHRVWRVVRPPAADKRAMAAP